MDPEKEQPAGAGEKPGDDRVGDEADQTAQAEGAHGRHEDACGQRRDDDQGDDGHQRLLGRRPLRHGGHDGGGDQGEDRRDFVLGHGDGAGIGTGDGHDQTRDGGGGQCHSDPRGDVGGHGPGKDQGGVGNRFNDGQNRRDHARDQVRDQTAGVKFVLEPGNEPGSIGLSLCISLHGGTPSGPVICLASWSDPCASVPGDRPKGCRATAGVA